MSKTGELLSHIAEGLDLPPEAAGGAQILVSAKRQVTVEGHRGIRLYCSERIEVRTRHGCAAILGQGLQICFLSLSRVVIRGKICALALEDDT